MTYLVESASVGVAVVDADDTAVDASVSTDAEIIWHERVAVRLVHDLTLKELTLRGARVALLGFLNLNGLVLEVVADDNLSDAAVLELALHDALFEVTVES